MEARTGVEVAHDPADQAGSISRRTFATAALGGAGAIIAGCQTVADTAKAEGSTHHDGNHDTTPVNSALTPVPGSDDIDPIEFPRTAQIGNNCRLSAIMAGHITFGNLYRALPWKYWLGFFKSRLPEAVNLGYLDPRRMNNDNLARKIQDVIDELDRIVIPGNPPLTLEYLLTQDYHGNNPTNPFNTLRAKSNVLSALGIFQPFHHTLPADRDNIINLFARSDQGGGWDFFGVLGNSTLWDLMCTPLRASQNAPDDPRNNVVARAKELRVIQTGHVWGANENVYPGRSTGNGHAAQAEAAHEAHLHALNSDEFRAFSNTPNGKCCDGVGCVFPNPPRPNAYCQVVSGGGCSIYSDDC